MKEEILLCLETSGPKCSVAIGNSNQILAKISAEGDWSHSQYLSAYIDQALSAAGLQPTDLSGIAISKGPGSYTGLRVGASTAKGLCYAVGIPLIAIDTLKIIAFDIWKQISSKEELRIIPLIDARREEVYYTVFDNELNHISDTNNLILNDRSFNEYAEYNTIICGDGALKARDIIKSLSADCFQVSYPHAENMVELASRKLETQSFEDLAYFSPFYLKPPNITQSKKLV